jgi:hypothetical protein
MATATQIMQHDVGIDRRPQKCLEILLQAEREADEVVSDVLSAIKDHDAKGVELKAEAASLRAERGEKQNFEEDEVDNMEALKGLDVSGTTMIASMMKTTMNWMTAGYRRLQPATNTYINLVLSSNVCAIAILHCIRSSSYRVIYTIGWVNLRLRKRRQRTNQQTGYATSY